MELIDTHCHLSNVPQEKLPEILERAKDAHITRCVAIGASDGKMSAKDSLKIAKTFDNVYCTIGVHPHDAKEHADINDLEEMASHPKSLAVGETGLDFFRDWAPKENQERLFRNSVGLALNLNKPLIIHSREAADESFKVLKEMKAEKVGGVYHCYSEDSEFAKKLRDINFLVSFTGNLTFKKAEERREAAKNIPLEQIMLETDMPYMAPEPFRGGPSEPAHVLKIAETLAKVKARSLEEVADITTKTALDFFKIKD